MVRNSNHTIVPKTGLLLLTPLDSVLVSCEVRHGLDALAMWDEDEVAVDVAEGAGAVGGVEVVDRAHAVPGLSAKDGAHELNPGKVKMHVKKLIKSEEQICIKH